MNITFKKCLFLIIILCGCEKEQGNRNTQNWYFINDSSESLTLKVYAGNLLKGEFNIKPKRERYFASSSYDSYDIETPPGINKVSIELSNGVIFSDSCNYIQNPDFSYTRNCVLKPNSFFDVNSYEKKERKLLFSKKRVFDRYYRFKGL
jgi:hypothetical protein